MKITLNGEEMTLEQACTVRTLLDHRGLSAAPCAVEVNRQIVPKRQHEQRVLADGDRIEIVTLVGGG